MLPDQTTSPPVPAVVTQAPPAALSPDLKAMLDLAIRDGDPATVDRVFHYARRARPDAEAELDALQQGFRRELAARKEAAAATALARQARNDPFVNWGGQVEFGASWTTGAVSSVGVLGAADLERKGVGWSHRLQARGELQHTDGARAIERLAVSWQPRRELGGAGYLFGLTQYEHDPVLGYDSRLSGGLGAGLRVGRPDGLRVAIEGGPAVRRTEGPLEHRTSIAGRGSADLNWPLSSRLAFQHKASAYYEEGKANGTLLSALDTKVSSRVKLRVSHEYRYQEERTRQVSGSASRASLLFNL